MPWNVCKSYATVILDIVLARIAYLQEVALFLQICFSLTIKSG